MLSTIPDPAPFSYPVEVAALGRTVEPPTEFERALARSIGRAGLFRCFDPAYFLAGHLTDRASATDWEPQASTGSADPVAATINGKPALGFTKGSSRALLSSAAWGGGSFTVIIVREQSSGQAGTAGAVLFGMGNSLGDLCHARQDGGGMTFFADTTGTKVVATSRANGIFIDVMTYNADTDTGKFLDEDGATLGSFGFGAGPGISTPLWLGGFQSGFGFDGKIGHCLMASRDMSLTENATTLAAALSELRDFYGL